LGGSLGNWLAGFVLAGFFGSRSSSGLRLDRSHRFRGKVEEHPFAFQFGQLLYFSQVLKGLSKLKQQNFAPLFEDYAPPHEMHVRFDLRAFAQKLLRMLQFESKVVIIGVRTETDFFQDDLGLLGFQLARFLLLLVFEFRVVDNTANRRNSSGRNLNKVEILLLRKAPGLINRIDALFDVVTDEAYFPSRNLLVDFERLLDLSTGNIAAVRGSYGLVILRVS
jgi:hypothetical protein